MSIINLTSSRRGILLDAIHGESDVKMVSITRDGARNDIKKDQVGGLAEFERHTKPTTRKIPLNILKLPADDSAGAALQTVLVSHVHFPTLVIPLINTRGA